MQKKSSLDSSLGPLFIDLALLMLYKFWKLVIKIVDAVIPNATTTLRGRRGIWTGKCCRKLAHWTRSAGNLPSILIPWIEGRGNDLGELSKN